MSTQKILGQTGDASSAVDLYTVSSGRQATLFVWAVNRSSSERTVEVWVRDGGASAADSHVVAADLPVQPNDTQLIGAITVSATDVVTVQASTSDVSFSAFGIESDIP